MLRNSTNLIIRGVSALVLLSVMSGCTRWNWRGHGYDEPTAWTSKIRLPADEKQFTGLDNRARDIERNLGVR